MNPSADTRLIVLDRAQMSCELCYGGLSSSSVHHRRPRGMGGSKDPAINEPSNLLVICGSGTTGCHGYVESHRAEAYQNGWLVRTGYVPDTVPFIDAQGSWWLLVGNEKLPIVMPFSTEDL